MSHRVSTDGGDSVDYEYDPLSQLTNVATTVGSTTTAEDYDATSAGLLTEIVGGRALTYNTAQHLVTADAIIATENGCTPEMLEGYVQAVGGVVGTGLIATGGVGGLRGLTGSTVAGSTASSAASAALPRSTGDIVAELAPGKTKNVWLAEDEGSLVGTFDELAEGGTQSSWMGYPGQVFERPDGVQVGLRPTSSSGGATIDIRFPDSQKPWKVHVK